MTVQQATGIGCIYPPILRIVISYFVPNPDQPISEMYTLFEFGKYLNITLDSSAIDFMAKRINFLANSLNLKEPIFVLNAQKADAFWLSKNSDQSKSAITSFSQFHESFAKNSFGMLHLASTNIPILRELLSIQGLDVNQINKGETPLHAAALSASALGVKMLLSEKANPKILSDDKQTALKAVADKNKRRKSGPEFEMSYTNISTLLRDAEKSKK